MPPIAYLLLFGAAALVVTLMRKQQARPLLPPSVTSPGVGPTRPASPPAETVGPTHVGHYSPDTAIRLAPEMAADITEMGKRADAELVRAFQAAAGLGVDGKYGPEARGALRYWLRVAGSEVEPPNVLYGSGETPYLPPDGIQRLTSDQPKPEEDRPALSWPPVAGFDPQAAIFYAPLVAEAASMGKSYRTHPDMVKAVRAFQISARVDVDGLYGPETRGALVFWLQQGKSELAAPRALWGSGTKTYQPPA